MLKGHSHLYLLCKGGLLWSSQENVVMRKVFLCGESTMKLFLIEALAVNSDVCLGII